MLAEATRLAWLSDKTAVLLLAEADATCDAVRLTILSDSTAALFDVLAEATRLV